MLLFLCTITSMLILTSTTAVFGKNCSTEERNNTTAECISQCITSLYELINCTGYEKINNLTDIIANRNETMPALIPNEYLNIKGHMVSVKSYNCDNQLGRNVYHRPNELIDFMNILEDIEQSKGELNNQTLKEMISLFEQIKSKFNQSNQWCVRSLGLEEQMEQIKQKSNTSNTSLEMKPTIVLTISGTTEHEPLNFTYFVDSVRAHPKEHHYIRSVWLILFISLILMAVLVTMSVFLRNHLSKNTQQPVQPKSMLNLIE